MPDTDRLALQELIKFGMHASIRSPFPLLHHLHKILKQIMRVMRPRRSLGVILHAEERQVLVPQAFESLIVQVDVREFYFALRQRIGIDGEVVVVCCDFNLPGLQLFHRMIPAVMSELQLESFSAESDAGKLMSQTNSKDWLATHQAPNRIHRVGAGLGVAGAIREKYSIRLQCDYIFG